MKTFRPGIALKGLSLVLVLALACPLPSFARAGKVRSNKAIVHLGQSAYKGTMLYVDRELLVLKEKDSGELLGFAPAGLDKVSIKKSRASLGLLVGLGIGVGLAALLIGSVKKEGDNLAAVVVVPLVLAAAIVAGVAIAAVTSTAGGLVGLLVGKKNFKLARMSPEKREAALAKLKRYAVLEVLPEELRAKVAMVSGR